MTNTRHIAETYRGFDIYVVPDMVGGEYYHTPKLTTKIIPVNFYPSLRMMKKEIDRELDFKPINAITKI